MHRRVALAGLAVIVACAPPESLSPVSAEFRVDEVLDFGSIYVGSSTTTSLHLEATGRADVSVQAMTATSPEIALAAGAPFEISGRSERTVELSWSPTAEGSLDALLLVDTGLGRFVVALYGVALAQPDCADANPCTVDDFEIQAGECTHTRVGDGTSCSDGETCTSADACLSGVCIGVPYSCDSGDPCTVASCDSNGGCIFTALEDGDACGLLTCAGLPLCQSGDCVLYPIDGFPCDDGLTCTEDDACSGGACAGTPIVCDDDPCTNDSCDEWVGGCVIPSRAEACEDDNWCTADICDSDAGCIHIQEDDACEPEVWYALGDSDFAPWSQWTRWGSAGGGGISSDSGLSYLPRMVVGAVGRPVVAWQDVTTRRIYVRRWSGAAWEELGMGSASGEGIASISGCFSLALDAAGWPVVAWNDDASGNSEVYVRRFDGMAWQEVGAGSASGGGISNNAGKSGCSSVAVDAANRVVVAWEDDTSGTSEIYVRRFDGIAWEEVGDASASAGSGWARTPSLALDPAGRPIVAWTYGFSIQGEVYVRRFDGVAWQDVGEGSATAGGISKLGYSDYPSLALDAAGRPWVAWHDLATAEVYIRRFDGTAWVEVGVGSASGGGISNNSGSSYYPSLALDGAGHPVVAWHDSTSDQLQVYVRRFDGASWKEVGDHSASATGISDMSDSAMPALALDAAGHPVVAWYKNYFSDWEVYVRRFDGAAWVQLGDGNASGGGISNTSGGSLYPALAFDPVGKPVVAWHELTGVRDDVYVRRFDGSAWQQVGDSPAGAEATDHGLSYYDYPTALALDTLGRPVIAWHDADTNGYEIYVRRFDGTAWQQVDDEAAIESGISHRPGISALPALALDALDRPVVAWLGENGGNSEIYLRRFDGSVWIEVGEGSASGGGISNTPDYSSFPALALDALDRPVVAWSDYSSGNEEIYVRRFDGSAWQEVGGASASGGGISNNSGASQAPSLVLDGTGQPLVAWHDDTSGNYEIYARHFDGTVWQELGDSSASGGGISNNSGFSASPSLALDAAGRVVVAWYDDTSGNYETYVKKWDGAAWTELALSASAGGISRSAASGSARPSVAVSPTGEVCVAWSEPGRQSPEIVLRCAEWP